MFFDGHFEVCKKGKKSSTLDDRKAICHAILHKTTSKVGRRRHLWHVQALAPQDCTVVCSGQWRQISWRGWYLGQVKHNRGSMAKCPTLPKQTKNCFREADAFACQGTAWLQEMPSINHAHCFFCWRLAWTSAARGASEPFLTYDIYTAAGEAQAPTQTDMPNPKENKGSCLQSEDCFSTSHL